MDLKEMIDANSEKGYLYIGAIDGQHIWKKFDGNATVYYLDEGYEEVLPVWNTLRSKYILKLIFEDLK